MIKPPTSLQLALANRVAAGHLSDCAKRFIGSAECTCAHADAEIALAALERDSAAVYSLFDLIINADSIYIDSVETDGFSIEYHYGDLKTLRLTCTDHDYYFENQQVCLLDTGEVFAIDCEEDAEEPGTRYRLLLRVMRPINASDLTHRVQG